MDASIYVLAADQLEFLVSLSWSILALCFGVIGTVCFGFRFIQPSDKLPRAQAFFGLMLSLGIAAMPGLLFERFFLPTVLVILGLTFAGLTTQTVIHSRESQETPGFETHWGAFGGGVHGVLIRPHMALGILALITLAAWLYLGGALLKARLETSEQQQPPEINCQCKSDPGKPCKCEEELCKALGISVPTRKSPTLNPGPAASTPSGSQKANPTSTGSTTSGNASPKSEGTTATGSGNSTNGSGSSSK